MVRAFIVDALREKVDDDVSLADVYQHIIFKSDAASREDRTLLVALRAAGPTQSGNAGLLEDEFIRSDVDLLEDAEADAKVADVVSWPGVDDLCPMLLVRRADATVEPDLEVAAPVLLGVLSIPRRDHEVVDNHRRRLIAVKLVLVLQVRHRAKVSKAVGCQADLRILLFVVLGA